MKKFLSLVLALVLTMSLVVVPANAEGEEGGQTQQPATSVELNKTSATLYVGGDEADKKTTLHAEVTGSEETVTWETSNEGVATVSESGEVTAVAKGTATITAKAGDQTATCTVTVKDVYEITGLSSSITLTLGTKPTAKLSPKLMERGEEISEDVTFRFSSNDEIGRAHV